MDKIASPKKLVIILPVYNEALIVRKSVDTLVSFLTSPLYQVPLAISVVIADNNSGDGTGKISSELINQNRSKVTIDYFFTPKKGRGNAIVDVCKLCESDFYLYLDIDLPIELADIHKLVEPLITGEADVCVVKRLNTKRPFIRRLFTRTMFEVNKMLLGTSFDDIQSGAKSFNAAVAKTILPECRESGYFLDTELVVKSTESGLLVKEVGATWIDRRFPERSTKVSLVQDAVKAFMAVLRIFKALNRKRALSLWLLFFSVLLNTAVWVYVARVSGGDSYIPLNARRYNHITSTLVPLMAVTFAFTLKVYSSLSVNLRSLGSRIACLNFALIILGILFTRPIYSQDVYWNLLVAKGFVQNNMNPYVTTPNNLSFLPWSQYVGAWRNMSLSHGPVSPLIHSVGALFSDVAIALLSLKLMYVAVLLLCVGVYFKLIGKLVPPEKQLLYQVVLLLNPFILLNTLSELHVDVVIMLALTAAYWALEDKKYVLAAFAVALASGTKYIMAVSLLPVIYALRRECVPTAKLLKGLAVLAFIFAVTLLVAYLPFGYGKHLFSGTIGTQISVYSYSATLPFTIFIKWLLGITPEVLKMLGLGLLCASSLYFSIKRKFLEAFVFPYTLLFLFGTDWLFPWYFLWIFPLLVLLAKNIELIYWVSLFLIIGVEGVGLVASFFVTLALYSIYKLVKLMTSHIYAPRL
jgi:glycosyltransferase involved in cell wall biosynthesis